jgi:septal ring factor EnvC (AmiA/AmiB activator)
MPSNSNYVVRSLLFQSVIVASKLLELNTPGFLSALLRVVLFASAALTKKLHHSITLSTRPPSHPSEAQHQSHLQQLDTQKFSLGKTINERQSRAARTEKEIEMLREEVEELTREREDWDRGVLPSGSAGGDELDGEA